MHSTGIHCAASFKSETVKAALCRVIFVVFVYMKTILHSQ